MKTTMPLLLKKGYVKIGDNIKSLMKYTIGGMFGSFYGYIFGQSMRWQYVTDTIHNLRGEGLTKEAIDASYEAAKNYGYNHYTIPITILGTLGGIAVVKVGPTLLDKATRKYHELKKEI